MVLMEIESIEFKKIDLESHRDIVIKFREDSFVSSFGNADRFYEADGQGHLRYLDWLQNKIQYDASFGVHAWQGDEIIGQLELGLLKGDDSIGYVNLYYLIPEKRGSGLAQILDEYTTMVFKNLGKRRVRLSVSPTNSRALNFYLKMGWTDLGTRSDHPEVNFMEKLF